MAARYQKSDNLTITSHVEKLTKSSQLIGYDLIIVAVDNDAPRKLVHGYGILWADLRLRRLDNHYHDTHQLPGFGAKAAYKLSIAGCDRIWK